MSSRPEVLRAFQALAPSAEVSAPLCDAAGQGSLATPTDLRAICTCIGLPQASAADVEKALHSGQAVGIFSRRSALTWQCVDDALARNVSPMLEGVHLYRSKLHQDEDVVDVVLTKPPSPSQMSAKLESMLAGSWGLRDTGNYYPRLRSRRNNHSPS